MAFTVSPTEAQAMQEDEAQLLMAITQAARSLTTVLPSPQTSVEKPPETLRIQMGRRLVYGQMARGEFRHELNLDRIKAISDAIQRPVTEGRNFEQYRGKVPAIEISDGNTILFREERDGTVSINQIQVQLEQRRPQTSPQVVGNGKHPIEQSDQLKTTSEQTPAIVQNPDWQANGLAQVAEYLLNPLGNIAPLYDAVSIRGYQISQAGDGLKVSKDNALILHTSNGKILEHHINQTDWETFQGLMIHPVSWNAQQRLQVDPGSPVQENLSMNRNGGRSIHPAIAVAERQIAQLPAGETRQLLTVTVQNWKQQISHGLQQGLNWLVSLPEGWRNHQIAQAALELFQRGYERTGEKSYQAGDYTISLRGQNLYSLSDHSGELMRFKPSKLLLYNQGVQIVLTRDRLGASHYRQIKKMQQHLVFMPQGSLGIETIYTAKTSKVEQTVKDFLLNHVGATVWNKEGGRFKLEIGDNFLRITDKQGDRGIIFQRKDGKVLSKLGSGDFKHFERLASRMAQAEQRAAEQPIPSGTHLRPRSSALEVG